MVYGAMHRLLINELPFSIDFSGAPLNAEIPINEFLLPEKSVLSVELFPLNGQKELMKGAEVTVTIKRYDTHESSKDGIVVLSLVREPGSIKHLPAFVHKEAFENTPIVSSQPEWRSGRVIETKDRQTVDAIYGYAEKIRSLFVAKNTAEILSLFSRKFRHYEEVYNLPQGNRNTVTAHKLEEVFSDHGFQLAPFNRLIFFPMLYGFGKIATLQDSLCYSFLIYYHREREELVEFPVYLSIDKSGAYYVSF